MCVFWLLRLLMVTTMCHVVIISTTRVVSRLDGDIMLGALFPIHAKGKGSSGQGLCGDLQVDDGIQPLEALYYTLDKINADEKLLPNIKLGVIALDSCDNIVYALDQCLDFIKGTVEKSFMVKMHNNQNFMCTNGSSSMEGFSKIVGQQPPVVGVIGDQSSDVTIQVTSLLRIFKIPLISYQSTSPTLSDRERFAYFFRTVPSDVTQAYAILEILRNFTWTYASLVYEDSEYGVKGYETLLSLSSNYNVCFSAQIRVDVKRFNTSDYDQVISELQSHARIVVLFSGKAAANHLMNAAKRVKNSDDKNFKSLIWIGCDGWSSRDSVTKGLETVVEGAITVQPLVRQLDGFDDYFRNKLRPSRAYRNPWFNEFWQEFFKCKLKVEELPPGILSRYDYKEVCKDNKYIEKDRFVEVKYLHFVRDAVYAYAHALHRQWETECDGIPGVCEKMRNSDGSSLKFYLESANFTDLNNKHFQFDKYGDGPPRYSILNFRKREDDSYSWEEIGNFYREHDSAYKLDIDRKKMQYKRYERSYPNSTCKQHCDPTKGWVPLLKNSSSPSCCPECKKCGQYEFVEAGHCQPCPDGTKPNGNRTNCTLIDEEIIDYHNPWAAGAMVFAILGILLTLAVSYVFFRHRSTPVIKASGRELSAILLVATLCSFAMTFLIASRPSPTKCGITRFMLGLTHTLAFAAIAVKTNRVARIFGRTTGKASAAACPRAKYISPKSQLAITGALSLIEVIVNAGWLIHAPPKTTHTVHSYNSPDRRRILICEGMDNYTYLVGLVYPLILIGCCTVYAFQTRKCPGGFNEARYIAFTTYTTCVLWMAFIPLFLTAPSSALRIVTLAMSLSISGLVQLACLFFPKVYIVLCKPEKNTREGVMAQHRSSSYALATPPAIALNSLQNTAKSSVTNNGTARKSSPSICLIPFAENSTEHVTDNDESNQMTVNSLDQLHLPHDKINTSSESIASGTKSKGNVHFSCEENEGYRHRHLSADDVLISAKSTDQLHR